MKNYEIKLDDGQIFKASYIGLNHTSDGKVYDNIAATYSRYFASDDEVLVEYEPKDIRCISIGNILGAYKSLRDLIYGRNPHNFQEYAECVEQVIIEFFGYTSSTKRHQAYYFDNKKFKYNEIKKIKVSDLAHKSVATSIEGAMLSQNLLMECGISTVFKVSGAIINGKNRIHAYNLIHNDGKYYIFDSSIPTIVDSRLTPVICEIPEKVYLQMINPSSDIGYSVSVSHINPLQNREFEVTYDAGREKTYKTSKEKVKKMV